MAAFVQRLLPLLQFYHRRYSGLHETCRYISLSISDPEHTSRSTKIFMILNNINHFPTPPESPDLMPIEMVWNDLKFYLTNNCSLKSKGSLLFHIKKFWKSKMNDLAYCNSKFDHIPRVMDQIIAVCGRASGL